MKIAHFWEADAGKFPYSSTITPLHTRGSHLKSCYDIFYGMCCCWRNETDECAVAVQSLLLYIIAKLWYNSICYALNKTYLTSLRSLRSPLKSMYGFQAQQRSLSSLIYSVPVTTKKLVFLTHNTFTVRVTHQSHRTCQHFNYSGDRENISRYPEGLSVTLSTLFVTELEISTCHQRQTEGQTLLSLNTETELNVPYTIQNYSVCAPWHIGGGGKLNLKSDA